MSDPKPNAKAAAASSSSADAEKKDSSKEEKKEAVDEALERSAYSMEMVVVHPLVLLSVVDHYTRVAKDTNKRVVGVLLGEVYKGKADVTNSYAVPFEEDPKDPSIWYVDRQYHEDMFAMFKKVNGRRKRRQQQAECDCCSHAPLSSSRTVPVLSSLQLARRCSAGTRPAPRSDQLTLVRCSLPAERVWLYSALCGTHLLLFVPLFCVCDCRDQRDVSFLHERSHPRDCGCESQG